ncbi:HDOD domain-containing protein [Propionivibrio sp.]|uniref:HDOD domain-containing protein n=1 Tax=Propionivibrio sp. TaxID=2212460 RepID=UPI003BEF92EC
MVFDKTLLVDLSGEESKSVKRLFDKGITIPTQPRVLHQLQEQLASGVADVRVLSRTIAQDPGIGSMLFRVVQSAVFRKFQPFDSLEHILQAVGLQQTGNLVRAIALSSALPAKHNQKAFEAYWARSQAVSELAMLIAEDRVTVCNIFPDQACLAGIFHDCGVPVLMQRFSTYCKDMHLDDPENWIDLAEEDARFNADHCVIGYLVGRHWKLPDFICDSIRYHHDINRIENHAARTMVAILQLAIHFYHLNQRINNPEWDGVRHEVLDELGLGEDTLPELFDVILERYNRTA